MKKAKEPNEWESLQIRLPDGESLEVLQEDLDAVGHLLTKREVKNPYGETKKVWRRNHVLLECIKIGLKELRKRR